MTGPSSAPGRKARARICVLPVIEIGGHGVLIPAALGWAHEDAADPDHPRFHRLDRIAALPALIARIEAGG